MYNPKVNINPNNSSIFSIENDAGNIFSLNDEGELVITGYPKKILSTLVSTFKIDGENVVMTSYTSKDKAVMPSADEFTDTKAPVKEDIVIDFEYGVFELTDKPNLDIARHHLIIRIRCNHILTKIIYRLTSFIY